MIREEMRDSVTHLEGSDSRLYNVPISSSPTSNFWLSLTARIEEGREARISSSPADSERGAAE
jgi:hypothetical protein